MAQGIKILLSEEQHAGPVLKVIGVGGCGGNVVKRMADEKIQGIEFVAINTDAQVLKHLAPPVQKLQIGEKLTRGFGTGSNPDIGEQAAIEDQNSINQLLDNANMIFITAGMGGGTGTGAAPVIASTAQALGILTVAVVTKPFSYEGKSKMGFAEKGLAKLKDNVDALIIVPNDKLLDFKESNISYMEAFKKSDEVLLNAVRGISDIINGTGMQNVDFADVRTALSSKGFTLMGTGEARGENRAEEATLKALNSPLIENASIAGASSILYNITCSRSLSLMEVNRISELITGNASADAMIKYGVIMDEAMEDMIRITVIATGFTGESKAPEQKKIATQRAPTPEKVFFPTRPLVEKYPPATPNFKRMAYMDEPSAANLTFKPQPSIEVEDEFDTPAFQRRVKGGQKHETKN
jgi:cell division protein FtsZ